MAGGRPAPATVVCYGRVQLALVFSTEASSGREQVARFNALLFEFSQRHRASIVMQAPPGNFLQFVGDLLQSFPLRGR